MVPTALDPSSGNFKASVVVISDLMELARRANEDLLAVLQADERAGGWRLGAVAGHTKELLVRPVEQLQARLKRARGVTLSDNSGGRCEWNLKLDSPTGLRAQISTPDTPTLRRSLADRRVACASNRVASDSSWDPWELAHVGADSSYPSDQ